MSLPSVAVLVAVRRRFGPAPALSVISLVAVVLSLLAPTSASATTALAGDKALRSTTVMRATDCVSTPGKLSGSTRNGGKQKNTGNVPKSTAPSTSSRAEACPSGTGTSQRTASQRAEIATALASPTPKAVDSLTTETRQVTAVPGKGLVARITPVPTRVRKANAPNADNGGWVPINPTLGADETTGRLVPAAADVAYSITADGTGPLVRLTGTDGDDLKVSWPDEYGPLPAPSVEGDVVRFSAVWPGVDLMIKSTGYGVATYLVVYTADAASLPQVADFGLNVAATGLALATSDDGRFSATDAAGKVVFSSAPARAWDSGDALSAAESKTLATTAKQEEARAAAPTSTTEKSLTKTARKLTTQPDGAHSGDVSVKLTKADHAAATRDTGDSVRAGRLSLAVDPKLLARHDLKLPLVIDPTIQSADIQDNWAMVWSTGESWYGTSSGEVPRVGYDGWSDAPKVSRSFFRFDVTGLAGTEVTAATFVHQQTHSPQHECGGTGDPGVKVYRTYPYTSSIAWPGPDKMGLQDTNYNLRGSSEYCPNDITQSWNVKNAVVNILDDGNPILSLGMYSADETDEYGWRKYAAPESSMPYLQVTYHIPPAPTAPTVLTDTGATPAKVDGKPWFASSASPALRVAVTDDANHGPLSVEFQTLNADGTPRPQVATVDNVPLGSTAAIIWSSLPSATYGWRARTTDALGAIGPWTNGPQFVINQRAQADTPLITPNADPSTGTKFSAVITDPDRPAATNLTATFSLYRGDTVVWSGTSGSVTSGGTATVSSTYSFPTTAGSSSGAQIAPRALAAAADEGDYTLGVSVNDGTESAANAGARSFTADDVLSGCAATLGNSWTKTRFSMCMQGESPYAIVPTVDGVPVPAPVGGATFTVRHSVTLNKNTGTWTDEVMTRWIPGSTWGVMAVEPAATVTMDATCTSFCTVAEGSVLTAEMVPGDVLSGVHTFTDPQAPDAQDTTTLQYGHLVDSPLTAVDIGSTYASPDVRCDAAVGARTVTGCVVPDVVPTFQVDTVNDPVAAAGIRWAQQNLSGAMGLKSSGLPLRREADATVQDQQRTRVCGSGWTPDPNLPNDSCDEYPFAATKQGGSMAGTDCAEITPDANGNVTVINSGVAGATCQRAHVPLDQNSSVGTDLSNFVQGQRVLDDEPFWVSA